MASPQTVPTHYFSDLGFLCQQPPTRILLDERRSLLDLNHPSGCTGADLLYPLCNPVCEVEQLLGVRRVLTFQHRWFALIARATDLRIELDAAEEVNPELARGLFRATAREDVDFMIAVWANKVTHVLDDAGDINFHLAEHLDGLARILQGDVRGRRYNDGCGQWDRLDQRQSHVTGSGRKIDDEIVEFAPLYLAEELANDGVQHWTAPDQRLVTGIQQTHGNGLQSVDGERFDAILANHPRLSIGAEH